MSLEVEDYSILNIHGMWQKSLKTDKPGGLRAKELFLDWLHQSEQ
jgi:hypothetical protein